MALFDFFRRRKPTPEGRPASSGGFRGFLSRLFGRGPKAEDLPEVPAAAPEPDEEPFDLFGEGEDVYNPPAPEMPAIEDAGSPADDLADVTTVSDSHLLGRYGDMLDSMVKKGYIDEFKSESDAAEFLRVLSSKAWEEAHAYWYSATALAEIQAAIEKGATAGGLQTEYNQMRDSRSNDYLATWDQWINPEA